jgi:hypothetical protein
MLSIIMNNTNNFVLQTSFTKKILSYKSIIISLKNNIME